MTRVNVGLEYRGFDLMTRGWTVKALGLPESVPARRGENLVVPGRPGRFLTRKPLDQRVVTVAILVDSRHPTVESEARTDAQLWANLDALRGVLAQDGPGELRYTTPGGTRVAQAEVTSFVEFKPEGPWAYSAVVEFTLADPFWYDESPITVGPTAIIQNPQNFALNNPGHLLERAEAHPHRPRPGPAIRGGRDLDGVRLQPFRWTDPGDRRRLFFGEGGWGGAGGPGGARWPSLLADRPPGRLHAGGEGGGLRDRDHAEDRVDAAIRVRREGKWRGSLWTAGSC
jgi:hypothetical protein